MVKKMSLDAFMGTKGKKNEKLKKKKGKKKKKTKSKEKIEEIREKNTIEINGSTEIEQDKTSIYKMITIKLSCIGKCGYKKTLKRSKTFTLQEKDIICPKCGKRMRTKQS